MDSSKTFFLKQVDIRNYNEVEEACKDVDCVYHLASYGMSGREQVWFVLLSNPKDILDFSEISGVSLTLFIVAAWYEGYAKCL